MNLTDVMGKQYKELGKKDFGFVTRGYEQDVPCLNLYIWSKDFKTEYKQFLISPTCRMPLEEEQLFTKMCKKKNLYIEQKTIQDVFNCYYLSYPEMHLRPYESGIHMLHHIYCTLHEGLEELLYKAELGYLALHLDEIDDYNLIGTNPSAVFDGLPMNVLRALNTTQGILAIKTEKQREQLYSLYMQAFQLFKRPWSIGQCKYFAEVICARTEEGFYLDDKKKLAYLAIYRTLEDYTKLLKYEKQVEALKGIATFPTLPSENENVFESPFYRADYLYRTLVENAAALNWKLNIAYGFQGNDLEYQDDNYFIRWPESVQEIYEESESQHNCLWTYIEKVAKGETIILFLRKKNAPKESFVTVEIYKGFMIQAKGRFNKIVGETELDWLEKYATEKNIIFFREELME